MISVLLYGFIHLYQEDTALARIHPSWSQLEVPLAPLRRSLRLPDTLHHAILLRSATDHTSRGVPVYCIDVFRLCMLASVSCEVAAEQGATVKCTVLETLEDDRILLKVITQAATSLVAAAAAGSKASNPAPSPVRAGGAGSVASSPADAASLSPSTVRELLPVALQVENWLSDHHLSDPDVASAVLKYVCILAAVVCAGKLNLTLIALHSMPATCRCYKELLRTLSPADYEASLGSRLQNIVQRSAHTNYVRLQTDSQGHLVNAILVLNLIHVSFAHYLMVVMHSSDALSSNAADRSMDRRGLVQQQRGAHHCNW